MRIRLLAAALMLAGQALAVCPSGYGYYREITLEAAGSTLTDFTSTLCFNGAGGCNTAFAELKTTANGGRIENTTTSTTPYSRTIPADLVFVDTNGTSILPFEIDSYNATSGLLIAYVKKTLTTSPTTIYACYGNASVSTDQSSTTGAWDSSTLAVYHMGESSGTTANNSTSTANAALTGTTISATSSGKIGGAMDFTAGGSNFTATTSTAFHNPTAFTIQCWILLDNLGHGGNSSRIFEKVHQIILLSNGTLQYQGAWNGTLATWSTSAGAISTGSWMHVALSLDNTSTSNNPTLYINGAATSMTRDQAPTGTWSDSSRNFVVGNNLNSNRGIDGRMDQARWSSVVRSSDWVAEIADNENSPANWMTLGSEEEATPPAPAPKGSAPWMICCPKKVPNRATAVDGAWTWFNDPRAVRFGDNTYFGGVATDGSVRIWQFNHTTSAFSSFTLDSALEEDDHNNPAIIQLSDGRIAAFWSKHNDDSFYRVSTDPDSIAAWGSKQTVSTGAFSYANVFQVEDGTIYWFFRGTVTTDWDPHFRTTTEADLETNTWTAAVRMTNNANSHRPYLKYQLRTGTNEIWFAYMPDGDHNSGQSMYFAKFNTATGNFTKMDGTLIGTTASPWDPLNGEKVWDAATHGGTSLIYDFAIDGNGYPAIAFVQFPDYPSDLSDNHRYWYTRWNGTAWVSNEVVAAGGRLYNGNDGYSCGIAIDPANPNVIITARNTGPDTSCANMEKRETSDWGQTWTVTSILTSGHNLRPFVIPGNTTERWVGWFYGTYTSYIDYTTNIRIQKIP